MNLSVLKRRPPLMIEVSKLGGLSGCFCLWCTERADDPSCLLIDALCSRDLEWTVLPVVPMYRLGLELGSTTHSTHSVL